MNSPLRCSGSDLGSAAVDSAVKVRERVPSCSSVLAESDQCLVL